MNLVVKPTKRCNFNCSFCSSLTRTDEGDEITTKDIKRFLVRYPETTAIIINGGDPLMMSPEYFLDLIKYIKDNDLKTTISLSSNLWAFYKDPDKWLPVFKHDDILRVSTSFNYGEGRRITTTRPYTEEIFIKVVNKFKDLVGYMPFFIAIIDENNEDSVIKTAQLAKSLNTTCRINPVLKSGRQGKPYPVYKMYQFYLKLIELGLTDVEFNSKQLAEFTNEFTSCPLPYERACDENIRCLSVGHHYHSCPAFNDDYEADCGKYDIDFEAEMSGEMFKPLKKSIELMSLKSDCFTCSLFKLCNNCYKYIKDMKAEGDSYIKHHCLEMKKLQQKLEKYI